MARARIAQVLGLSAAESEQLLRRARARLSRPGYLLRAAAFLLATAPLLRLAIPATLRRRAVRPLLYALLASPSENLLYARPETPPGEPR